ncbi:hypothetical protein [Paludifilum halophilum]|uniref:Uncharacterized protein n=1 Tax=Paludifilum halophilum TaxID=1642702 RepID=A0A235B853_9BACL|nr:hypothetical protein [Paludifilum halophilum]OYD08474.1 hypothetical protein CHM34_06495 [Paludifilum halophilum]
MALHQNPFSVSLVGNPDRLSPARVEEILREKGLSPTFQARIPVLPDPTKHSRWWRLPISTG